MLKRAGGRPPFIPPLDYDHLFKLKIIGDLGCGRGCVIRRFVDDTYTESYIIRKSEIFDKTIVVKGKSIKLQIHLESNDGVEKFRNVGGPGIYYEIQGIIIIYDVTDQACFSNVKQWLQELDRYAPDNVKKLLVGNKCDLTTKREVEFDTAKQFADEHKIPFLETSAKNSVNVEEVFSLLATDIYETVTEKEAPVPQTSTVGVSPGKKQGKQKCRMQ